MSGLLIVRLPRMKLLLFGRVSVGCNVNTQCCYGLSLIIMSVCRLSFEAFYWLDICLLVRLWIYLSDVVWLTGKKTKSGYMYYKSFCSK